MSENLIKSFTATAQIMGTDLTIDAARVFIDDLREYPEHSVIESLAKCRREVKGKLTLADVIARIDDGRPGANEAWAMMPRSESESVVWTCEMAAAMVSAQPLLDAGDSVAARMAFIEHYQREVVQARHLKRTVQWTASLGHDARGREAVLRSAVDKNRLSFEQYKRLLPYGELSGSNPAVPALSGSVSIKALLQKAEPVAGDL